MFAPHIDRFFLAALALSVTSGCGDRKTHDRCIEFDPCRCDADRTRGPSPLDVVISSPADLENARGLQSVGGSLLLCGLGVDQADLSALGTLTTIEGDFVVGNNVGPLDFEGLGSLSTVGRSVFVYDNMDFLHRNRGVETFALPGLTNIGGELLVRGNERLTSIQLPALESVESAVTIWAAVPALDFPSVKRLGALEVRTSSLTRLAMPTLARVGRLDIEFCTALTELEFPALTIAYSLRIAYDSKLTTLDGLAALFSVTGDLTIRNNTSLPTCEATALRDRLLAAGGIGGKIDISGNNDAGTCN